jgi:hypothetical protein
MKVLEKNFALGLMTLISAYSLYAKSLSTTLTAVGLAAVVYALSKSSAAALVLLILAVFIKDINRVISPRREPMGVETVSMEGFQAKDPITVQKRLEDVKVGAPLQPKVQVITGVLESASILDNTPLQGVQELANEGVPGASIPASAKARVLIYPPPEDSIPAPSESMALTPKDNPYLQTGQDRLAQEVAMAQKGTELYAQDSASYAGVGSGAGPAF